MTVKPEMAKLEYYEATDGRWYYVAVDENDEIEAVSKGYAVRRNVRRAGRRDYPGVPLIYAP